jgi:hypothetical protein
MAFKGIRDGWVGITTRYGLDNRGVRVRVPVVSRIFCSPRRPGRFWGLSSLLSNGIPEALSPGVKRPEPEADHSPSASAEVKRMWIYISAYFYWIINTIDDDLLKTCYISASFPLWRTGFSSRKQFIVRTEQHWTEPSRAESSRTYSAREEEKRILPLTVYKESNCYLWLMNSILYQLRLCVIM